MDPQIKISPSSSVDERKDENRFFRDKLIKAKIRSLVMEKISLFPKGAFLALRTAPLTLGPLFPKANPIPWTRAASKKKQEIRKLPLFRRVPIGLLFVDELGITNSFMQFLLALPSFVERFYLAPKSFSLFTEFIDRYVLDQDAKKAVSGAKGDEIYAFLSALIPSKGVWEIFSFFYFTLQLEIKVYEEIEEALKEEGGKEFFLLKKERRKKTVAKQIFTHPSNDCYELDAFIELRADGKKFHWVCFVKVEGGWYQCIDDSITKLRSTSLSRALKMSVLFHYTKVPFPRNLS